MAIRLNAHKPTKKNAGLPSSKNGTIRLMRCEDVIAMPPTDSLGIACLGDFQLKPEAEFQFLYLTPKTQKYDINNTGDVDERLFKKKVFGSYPGNDLQIFEFVKNNINQGFIIVYKEDCEEYAKIFGSPKNPLFLSPNYQSDSTGKGFEITLEQNTSDNIPVLFYNGEFPVYIEEEGIIEIIDIIGQPIEGPYKSRRIYLVDVEPTGGDLAQFPFPVIFRICNTGQTLDVTFDKDGNRSVGGSGASTPDFTQHGPITTTPNSVTIGLSELGENFAMIAGTKYIEPTTNPETPKPFTAVSPGMLKVVIIQALPDAAVFHLAEGVEGVEATDPDYDGLLVKRIIVSDSGQVVEGDLDAFQLKANEAWVNLLLNDVGATVQTISVHHAALRFNIVSAAGNIKIGGFKFYASQYLYDGIEITLRNETAGPLEITTIAGIGIISIDADGLPITLKQFESISFAYHLIDGAFYAFNSGGEVFDPTSLQGQIDAEIVNRQIEDNKKLNKPTDDGSWVVTKSGSVFSYTSASSFGQNISNANLSNISARIFTQGNIFTWDTAGFLYYLKNLVDKTGQAAYSKVVVVHPTTGQTVTRDFADPAATTLAVQNANTTQKTAMRIALLGSSTPPSPIINVVNTYYIKRNTITMLILSGVNLVPLDPTSIWIQNGVSRVDAISYFALSSIGLQTFWNIPNSFPLGEYLVNLSFGSVSQGANIGKLVVIDESTVLEQNFDTTNTLVKVRDGYDLLPDTTAVVGKNSFRITRFSSNKPRAGDLSLDNVLKTSNVFLGAIGSSWEIVMDYTSIAGSGNNFASNIAYLTLTETSDLDFTSVNSIFVNYPIIFESGGSGIQIRGTNIEILPANVGIVVVIRKSQNILTTFLLNINTGAVTSFTTTSIDTTKNYALAFMCFSSANGVVVKNFNVRSSIYNS